VPGEEPTRRKWRAAEGVVVRHGRRCGLRAGEDECSCSPTFQAQVWSPRDRRPLRKTYATVAEAVADCSLVVGTTSVGNREVKHPLCGLVEAAPLVRERMATERVAVLFGSEKWGLSNEDLSYCHWLVKIATREEHRSMNLGQAAAVVLYELGKEAVQSAANRNAKIENGKFKIDGGEEFAEMETIERIGQAMLQALVKSGYVGPRKTELAEEKLRRMLRRFSLEAADAEVFLGMMRKIAAKLERNQVKK